MQRGKHLTPEKSHGSKSRVAIIALILLLCLTVGGATLAWLTTSASVTNTLKASKVTGDVVENVEDGVKSSVMIKNTGDTQAYIRVAVIANSVNEAGQITGTADVSASLAASGWTKLGDYYYWNYEVEPEALTGELLKSEIVLTGIQVTILAEAVESKPAKAVQEAWGVSISQGSVTPWVSN